MQVNKSCAACVPECTRVGACTAAGQRQADVHCRRYWKLTIAKQELLDSRDKETYSCVDLCAQFLKLVSVCMCVEGMCTYMQESPDL